MAARDEPVPDWRDGAAYAPLLDADRSLFAWEWIRRDQAYRMAFERALAFGGRDPDLSAAKPEQWGLLHFERPSLTVPRARPMWSAEAYPYVLGVEAGPPDGEEAFDIERLCAGATMAPGSNGREHLLISDGFRAIRIDVLKGTIAAGPCGLRYRLIGLAGAERPLLTLRRLLALWRTDRFSSSLHPRETRAKRWLTMLRAHDALAAGADQREIAAVLLGAEAGEPRWRSRCPHVRSQVQRLVRGARHMASGGYRQQLG